MNSKYGSLYYVPGKPVACNNGLLSINYGLLLGIVACYFGLLGVPGGSDWNTGPSYFHPLC